MFSLAVWSLWVAQRLVEHGKHGRPGAAVGLGMVFEAGHIGGGALAECCCPPMLYEVECPPPPIIGKERAFLFRTPARPRLPKTRARPLPMPDPIKLRLAQRLRRFTGVGDAEWRGDSLTITFDKDLNGEVAEIVWSRIAERFKLEATPQGWEMDDAQAEHCLRRVVYASADYFSSPDYQPDRDAGKPVGEDNLFSELSRIYTALEARIEQSAGLPFNVWANALRVLGTQPIEYWQFVQRTVLPRRAARVILRDLIALDWITLEGGGRHQRIRLTAKGGEAKQRIESAAARVSSTLLNALGENVAAVLVNRLGACIRPLAYELPWGLTSYGPGDGSLTGGPYVAAQSAPHFIPAHGEEWPVVQRRPGDAPGDQSLPTLFAKTLARFIVDYEHLNLGSVIDACRVQSFPDDGMPANDAKQRLDVTGNGRSGRERHFFIVTPIGRASNRRAYLTPKGRAERDALGWALERVQGSWRDALGEPTFDEFRDALARTLAQLMSEVETEPGVNPTRWFRQLHTIAQESNTRGA